LLVTVLIFLMNSAFSQNVLDNSSKAVFIFDMARYIDYGPGFADSAVFKIGVLDEKSELFWAKILQKSAKRYRISLFSLLYSEVRIKFSILRYCL